jgi:DNA-binding FadR family transcriptional regulator
MNFPELPVGKRRYLDIARRLAGDIKAGRYLAGHRLPPERELAQLLNVSRTTVREALLALEIMRFIEIRVGAGVFVLAEARRGHTEIAEPDSAPPSDVLAARRILEGETAALAAQNATASDIEALHRATEEMAGTIDQVERFDAADSDFHATIAAAAGSDVLAAFVSDLWQMRDSSMWALWYDQTRKAGNRLRSVEDHRAILRAIERGLPDIARTAMQSHLDVLAERFYQLKL